MSVPVANAPGTSAAPAAVDVTEDRGAIGRALLYGVGGAAVAAGVVIMAPYGNMLPAAVLGVGAFSAGASLLLGRRTAGGAGLRPITWALFTFAVVLVFVPLLCMMTGFERGVLPLLPSDRYLNVAVLLHTAAFAAFAFGVLGPVPRPLSFSVSSPALPWIGVVYVVLGAVGLFFAFGSVQTLASYFSNPAAYLLTKAAEDGQDPSGLAANVLRPFLIVGAVALWGAWHLRRGRDSGRVERIAAYGAVIAVILSVGATFNLNRNSIVVPLVAFSAVHVWSGGRFRLWLVAPAAATLSAALLLVGQVRGTAFVAVEALGLNAGSMFRELLSGVQVYGSGPQYLGFLVESSAFEGVPLLGSSLWSSLLFPVPILGKPWRESSGVAFYNQLIYGDSSVADQIIPFVGELFINFHIVGVIAGFYLLGRLILLLDVSLAAARDPLVRYALMYLAAWASFLILGSLAGVSQILVYFCWPLYGLAVVAMWPAVRRRLSARGHR